MREESNRVSCSSRDGMDKSKRGGGGGCCFVVQGLTNMTEVTYVVVAGVRELGDLLAEVQMHKEELVEQAEGKAKESEFLITAEAGRWA